jgi:hypothetical protein
VTTTADTTTAATTADTEADTETTTRTTSKGRARAIGLRPVALAVGVALVTTLAWGAVGTVRQADTQPALPGVSAMAYDVEPSINPVAAERDRALAHLRSTGALDTWSPTDVRVLGAGAGSTAVLSGIVEGVCWYTAIDAGLSTELLVDTTATACTQASVTAARSELLAAGAAARAEADGRAASHLAVAVKGAKMWASTNYVDGMPSFAGLPAQVAPGVFTVQHHVVEVVLEARTADGGCARAAVTAGGFVTELTCP